jgi:hypothetical protein
MDPFAEKDMIDSLKSIATSLRNIDRKMDDMAMSIRELAASQMGEEVEDIVEETGDSSNLT